MARKRKTPEEYAVISISGSGEVRILSLHSSESAAIKYRRANHIFATVRPARRGALKVGDEPIEWPWPYNS